jgi:DHA1 family bicyclomycin/chloramphenicol resistance-like MFS transporter
MGCVFKGDKIMVIKKPSFLLLFLLISFGSITAVAFTPALPEIGLFFNVSAKAAGLTITLFLVGYAIGQLLYGPLANRFGRKIALYIGIGLEIIASLLCVIAAPLHAFWLLVLARLLMALGASVGLKMSFTLVADSYTQEESRKIISHLMIAFAITPALGVAIGGFLVEHFAWISTFYFMAAYGLLVLVLTMRMPETAKSLDQNALKPARIWAKYSGTLGRVELPIAALLMGCATSFVYVFASLAPFIAMQTIGLNPAQYGMWNLLPVLGVITGSQLSAHLSQALSPIKAIAVGIGIMLIGVLIMVAAFLSGLITALFLFLPLLVIYIGLGFIYASASGIATAKIEDKSNASAMMSFINMGLTTLIVMALGFVHMGAVILLPIVYCILLGGAAVLGFILKKNTSVVLFYKRKESCKKY